MPKLLSSLRECFGFSQIIKLQALITSMALLEISPRLPIGVPIMYKPKEKLFILYLFIFLISCAPVNLYETNKNKETNQQKTNNIEEKFKKTEKLINTNKAEEKEVPQVLDYGLDKNITLLFSKDKTNQITKQFINIIELGVYDKNLETLNFEIKYFLNEEELRKIVQETKSKGKIYIGPIEKEYTKTALELCDDEIIFLSFSSDKNLAKKCVFLFNFFPKNELQQLFKYLEEDSRVALLYPENNYGYMINNIIDEVANQSEAVIVNRASYKNNLSNVRDAIKELGKYELRKYELNRQKKILLSKKGEQSKKRLKKLEKFKTTNDYDFTHILIADYGINLLQVAPLLPYYDIDPNIVQFIGTGVIDDENFFFEPSLQGAIFPGIEKNERLSLIKNYKEIYEDNFLRISTLPYDLMGLLNYLYTNDIKLDKFYELLNNSSIRFEGVDGNFYFKNNTIERELKILKILNGKATAIN